MEVLRQDHRLDPEASRRQAEPLLHHRWPWRLRHLVRLWRPGRRPGPAEHAAIRTREGSRRRPALRRRARPAPRGEVTTRPRAGHAAARYQAPGVAPFAPIALAGC